MRHFLRWLGGGDRSILARCPGEGIRYTATGCILLVVGALAAGSATLTARQFLHLSVGASLTLGGAWGIAIVALDRWLMLTIRRQSHPGYTLLQAVPRVALAVVAGLVVATPVVLVAFRDKVEAEATQNQREARRDGQNRVNAKYAPEISELQGQQDELEAKLVSASGAEIVSRDPVYRARTRRADALQRQAHEIGARALCEADGTCGTGDVGRGSVYETKRAAADELERKARAARRAATAREQALLAQQEAATERARRQARARLRTVRGRLADLREQRDLAEADVAAAYDVPIGLAERLDALEELKDHDAGIRKWARVLTLLLLLLDSAPAVGKAMTSIGRRTLYEQVQDEMERAAAEAATATCDARAEVARIEAQEIVDQARMHRELWQAPLHELLLKVVEVQREVTERYIEQWAWSARAEVTRWIRRTRDAEPETDAEGHDAQEVVRDERPATARRRRASRRNGLR